MQTTSFITRRTSALQVHDSHNLHFATKTWKLAVTDLNQVC